MMRSFDLNFLPFKQVHISQAQFGFNLLHETDFNKSVVISPISVSIALSMALLGAKGKTAEEIHDAIAKNISIEDVHKHFLNILEFVKKHYDVIKMADKAYCSDKFILLDEYKNRIQEFYCGHFQLIDFINAQEAANEINKFIESLTDNKIQEIVSPNMFNERTTMVLVNALKFDGKWENNFEVLPDKQIFYSSPDSTKEVFMMKKEVFCRHRKNDKYEMVDIPYEGGIFSLYIILPINRFGLSKLIKNIDISELLVSIIFKHGCKGTIFIPKFNIDSTFELSEMLKNLNIKEAFDGEKADFSGIGNISGLLISISNVLQKSMIEVNEIGTTAAAATVVEFKYLSTYQPTPFEFIANHPFIYFIMDKHQNIYFIGTFCG